MRELVEKEVTVILSVEHAGAAFKKVTGVIIDVTEDYIVLRERKMTSYIFTRHIVKINL